jgi:hypothetical protein
MHKSDYRPRLITLEDRVVPGTTLANSLDPSLMLTLGSSLSALDRELLSTGAESQVADLGRANVGAAIPAAVTGADLLVQVAGNQASGSLGNAAIGLGTANMLDSSHLLQLQQGFGIHSQGATVYDFAIVPGSGLIVNNNDQGLDGRNPPTDFYHGVSIGSDGTVFAAQQDDPIFFRTVSGGGSHFDLRFRMRSDMNGTFDSSSGSMSVTVAQDVKIDSMDAGGFDGTNCSTPVITLNFTTNDPSGNPFTFDNQGVGHGTIGDNIFGQDAIPYGACGGIPGFTDWATAINLTFGLPAPAGTNHFWLNVQATPQ